eukprot:480750-Prymnesium_polylepis.1
MPRSICFTPVKAEEVRFDQYAFRIAHFCRVALITDLALAVVQARTTWTAAFAAIGGGQSPLRAGAVERQVTPAEHLACDRTNEGSQELGVSKAPFTLQLSTGDSVKACGGNVLLFQSAPAILTVTAYSPRIGGVTDTK